MPFFNNTCQQTELFIETIDKLQGFLDLYAVMAPIKIVGDYNVQLPQGHKLKNNWYKLLGFNRHSVVMQDLLISNKMIVTDFMFQQSVKYIFVINQTSTHGLTMLPVAIMTLNISRAAISCPTCRVM